MARPSRGRRHAFGPDGGIATQAIMVSNDEPINDPGTASPAGRGAHRSRRDRDGTKARQILLS